MADVPKLARELPKFIVRFSEELRDKIKAAADKNKRSMNAELIQLIEEGFESRARDEWFEEQHREAMDDASIQAAFDHHDREMEEFYRVQEATMRAKRASMHLLHSPKDESQPMAMIVPPEGMLAEEFSQLMKRVLDDSNRQAMELFKSMIVRKGGHVVPIEDSEENP